MSCNITRKNLEPIVMGLHTGTGLKLADAVVEGLEGEVKDEMPSLPLAELKALQRSVRSDPLKRTYLLHT